MRKVSLLAILMLVVFTLCACGSCPTKTELVYVDVPVSVPCVKQVPEKPLFAVSLVKSTDDLPTLVDAYMVERHQRIAYEAKLEAVITGCVSDSN